MRILCVLKKFFVLQDLRLSRFPKASTFEHPRSLTHWHLLSCTLHTAQSTHLCVCMCAIRSLTIWIGFHLQMMLSVIFKIVSTAIMFKLCFQSNGTTIVRTALHCTMHIQITFKTYKSIQMFYLSHNYFRKTNLSMWVCAGKCVSVQELDAPKVKYLYSLLKHTIREMIKDRIICWIVWGLLWNQWVAIWTSVEIFLWNFQLQNDNNAQTNRNNPFGNNKKKSTATNDWNAGTFARLRFSQQSY